MAEVLVNKEAAEQEVNTWLDLMDISASKRAEPEIQDHIDVMVTATMHGFLVFNSDETVTQKLKKSLGNGATSEIVYDFRFEVGEYNKATKGIYATEHIDYCVARLALVSQKKYPKDVFLKMDRSDYHIACRLAVFF